MQTASKEFTQASDRLKISGDPSDMVISYSSGDARDSIILLAVTGASIAFTILPVLYMGQRRRRRRVGLRPEGFVLRDASYCGGRGDSSATRAARCAALALPRGS